LEPITVRPPANGGDSFKVLIVDDHKDKRHLLSCILKNHHFEVIEAENGREALSSIEVQRPDVALLDVLMPGIDGFEVCRRMKADPKFAEIPVLFVTVLDQHRSRVEGLELGAEDFISWPINAPELIARINARIRAARPLYQLRTALEEQSRLREQEQQREAETEWELEQARAVQRRFIVTTFPPGHGLVFASRYRPSRKVGGDLLDVFPVTDQEVALIVADISGHGIPAALLTSVAKVLFRTGAEQHREPGMLLRWLNGKISEYLATGEFLTVFIGLWNVRSHRFSYAGAGHPPALLFNANGQLLERLHVARGIVGIMPDGDFPETSITLQVGQRIVCYSDGITEAVNRSEEIFGEERLVDACSHAATLPLQKLVDRVFAEVDAFTGEHAQADDQALLALEVTK
jgi:serine phosphatase RsbU (regulator of sigma subunit)